MKKIIYCKLAIAIAFAVTAFFEINCTAAQIANPGKLSEEEAKSSKPMTETTSANMEKLSEEEVESSKPMTETTSANAEKSPDQTKLDFALLSASAQNNIKEVEALLKAGADVNASNKSFTPLHYAASNGLENIVEILLEAGADATRVTYEGGAPIHYIPKGRCRNIQIMIGDRLGYQLYEAVGEGDLKRMEVLIRAGANVNWLGRNYRTPLHYAVREGNIEAVKILLKNGANVVVNTPDKDNAKTPLHYAAQEGYIDILKILLEYGAQVDVMNNMGMTPLHYAAMGKHADIVEFLVKEAGANIRIKVSGYYTPLQLAAKNFSAFNVKKAEAFIKIVRCIVGAAYPNCNDANLKKYAKKLGDTDVEEALKKAQDLISEASAQ
ncbi:MAG: ankyrin repeat domain-containing protein [Holosporaceae bacterium]|jgi:ankyrin repeat protein|nr:ankyrin repeat domain-containing protein [Holosporaceae bacterium]